MCFSVIECLDSTVVDKRFISFKVDFQGTLGKVSSSSVLHPRQMVDLMHISKGSEQVNCDGLSFSAYGIKIFELKVLQNIVLISRFEPSGISSFYSWIV